MCRNRQEQTPFPQSETEHKTDGGLWRGQSDIMTDHSCVALMAKVPFISFRFQLFFMLVPNGVSGHLIIKVVAS